MAGVLTSNSPISLGGVPIVNPLAGNNTAAGGNSPSTPVGGTVSGTANTVGSIASLPIYTAPAASSGPTAAQLANAQAESDYNNLKGTTLGSINSGIGQSAAGYASSIQDYLDSEAQQQKSINSDAVQNELARIQGMQGVTDMVGNGIQSGGVILDNAGAGSSSAGDALAKAYGVLGRQQASSVGNQYAQGQNKVDTEQSNLEASNATEARHTQEDKVSTINSIVNDATTKLAALNQDAAYASIPDRVNIDQQIAQVKQQAMDALSAYDSELSGGLSGNAPTTQDANQASAQQLATAGVAPESAFDYTADVPAQFAGTGQFASSLPIFTTPKKTATA